MIHTIIYKKRSIRLAKRNYYQTLFAKFKCDIKSTWKTINEILNQTKHKIKFPLYFKDGENMVTSKELIVNKFNTFFTNIGSKLSQQIKRPKNKSFKDYLISNNNNQFKFQITNEEFVGQIIDKLAPKTSFGFDGIFSKLLKTIKDTVIKTITMIINQMLITGIFPDKLKIAKVIPIFEKEDETLYLLQTYFTITLNFQNF